MTTYLIFGKIGIKTHIQKPPDLDEFRILVANALERKELHTKVEQLQDELKDKYRLENIVGKSNENENIFDDVQSRPLGWHSANLR